MTIQRINPEPRWSDVTIYNGIAHFVEVPEDTKVSAEGQIKQVLALAEQRLALMGSDKTRLLSTTIYLTDRQNVEVMNRLWEAWLPAGCAPSRACVKVELLNPDMLIEMAFVAVCE
jgi:enamine deaminase RidA (YjgF/YER057c/UK114 family)